jgi:glycosyltransferase involved in cell wall biosynthesis
MRILLAVHQFFPEFRAGTETLVRRTAEELQRRGHQVWVLSGGLYDPQEPLLRAMEVEGLTVWRCNPPPPPAPLAGGMGQSYRRPELETLFQTLLGDLQPDLVHLFHLRRLTLSLLDVIQARQLPVVASLTDYWMGCPTGQLQWPDDQPCTGPLEGSANCLQHLAGRILPPLGICPLPFWRLLMALMPLRSLRELRRRPAAMAAAMATCDRILVPSAVMRQTFRALGVATHRMEICPYGIDLRGLRTVPVREAWPGSRLRPLQVGFIGSFTAAKGAHVLLQAVEILGPSWPAEVRLYGQLTDDPIYGAGLERQAQGLAQVRFAGVFGSDAVFSVLSSLDLLVVPSLWRENAPLIVLQALASGLPLLVSDGGGIADQVVAGENAWLFPAGDAQALASHLSRATKEPEALAALVNRGGQPRSIADYGEHLEQLYGQLLQR